MSLTEATVETNRGLAFAALTPPTTGRAVRPGHSDSDLERSQLYQELMRHTAVMNLHRGGGVLAPETHL